jgi:hypothetical protein
MAKLCAGEEIGAVILGVLELDVTHMGGVMVKSGVLHQAD